MMEITSAVMAAGQTALVRKHAAMGSSTLLSESSVMTITTPTEMAVAPPVRWKYVEMVSWTLVKSAMMAITLTAMDAPLIASH